MPRKAREKSSTGIYAILLESEYKIFRDDDDYNEFIGRIDEYLNMNAIAFALIESAVCLIVKETEQGIGKDIKPLTTSYARYYGAKYELDGGLFKQRFRSEPIESADDMAWNLACVHKLCETLGTEGYTGKYDGDEIIIGETAMALMGNSDKYDELMAEEKVLTSFFAVLSSDKPQQPPKTSVKKSTVKTEAKKKTVKKEKAEPVKTVKKEEEVKIDKKITNAEPEQPKVNKNKKMPTWLL